MDPNKSSANLVRNVTTNGKTQITGKFVLLSIIVNQKGSSTTAAIYDSASTQENKKGTLDTSASIVAIPYNIPMLKGIRIVTAGGTAADLTIVYARTP